ncbi:MAG: DUF2075 domain-containing protein [Lactobacillaceae bacterium]|jgi:DUF2075 family protein|nr:DUF2075 domain-containing protein [Lactobacillaceae bacterium]
MLNNSALTKFNVAELTPEQIQQIAQLENFIGQHLVQDSPAVAIIEGEAGAGKSVILTKLFQDLKDQNGKFAQTNSIFTVNHPELLKVYQELAKEQPNLRKADYVRPTSLINNAYKTDKTYDIILIDEGHLLLSKPEPYIKFTQINQLEELIKLAKVVIVVFDFKQVMQTKMYWDREMLTRIVAPYPHEFLHLDTQYRMQAPQAILDWINTLTTGEIHPRPADLGTYDFKIFDRAAALYALIQQKNAEVGLSRVVATTGFQRTSAGEHNVTMDDFNLPWDEYDVQPTPWAERPESINEVGSIYTIQGFDLNYVGVILGPPFEYDATTDRIVVNPDKVTHTEIYKRHPELTDPANIEMLKQTIMFNVLDVLMKRGIYGLYITAADDALRARLLEV